VTRPIAGAPETWTPLPTAPIIPARPLVQPACKYGYSYSELRKLLGEERLDRFEAEGMNTYTTLYCSGQVYDAATAEFWDGCGPHGPVFDAGKVDVWLEDIENGLTP
jgi:predicted heme/steroid binding protein